jgi:hypothetical protein
VDQTFGALRIRRNLTGRRRVIPAARKEARRRQYQRFLLTTPVASSLVNGKLLGNAPFSSEADSLQRTGRVGDSSSLRQANIKCNCVATNKMPREIEIHFAQPGQGSGMFFCCNLLAIICNGRSSVATSARACVFALPELSSTSTTGRDTLSCRRSLTCRCHPPTIAAIRWRQSIE